MKFSLVVGLAATLASAGAVAQAPGNCDRSAFDVQYGTWGVDTSGQDKRIDPGDNFAMYAWGKWYRETEIPPGAPAVWSRMEMRQRNHAMLRCSVELSARNPTTVNRRLIADLYNSYMNTDRIDQVGETPLLRDLSAIRQARSKREIAEQMGRTASSFGLAFFRPTVAPRVDKPTQHILRLVQSGLGAGPREFYLDPKNAEARAAYEQYIARMLRLIGWPHPDRYAKQILQLETGIAEASWSQSESDDVSAMLNIVTPAQLASMAPGFDWAAYFKGAGLEDVRSLVTVQKSAFPKIATIFARTPLPTLKAWMAFHKANSAAPYLSSRYRQAHFDFWGRSRGLEEPQPRADSAIEVVSQALVHPVAREYMALYFSPDTKAAIEDMVVNIKAGMRQRLRNADWMEPQTKREAIAKLDALEVGIGHPDKWRDFSGLQLRTDDLYGNIQRIAGFNWDWTAGKLNRPVDRGEWVLEPFALGAAASYPRGLITISTGFIQPPNYDPDADPAVNYGALGATIGHEIGHFFDAGGAQFDATGRMRNWWTPADAAEFQRKVDRMVARLSSYKEESGEPVDGAAALREQMSHQIGLKAALDGYRLSLRGKPAPVIDGYTGDQRVFLSYAQMWQGKATDWFRKEQYEHAPLKVIVNDALRNIDDWYSAFDVKSGDDLYLPPEQRIRIW